MKWVFENWVEVTEDHTTAGGSSYHCRKCPRSFKYRNEAIRHAATCGAPSKVKKRGKNTRMMTCNLCPFKASTRAKLAKHRISEHRDLLRQSINCTTCQKSFKSVKNLKEHMKKVHIKSKVFMCSKCPMKFTSKFSRNRHLNTHLGGGEEATRMRVVMEQALESSARHSDVDSLQGNDDDHDHDLQEEGGYHEEEVGEADASKGDVDDLPAELSQAVTQRNEAINDKTEKYLDICREWGDSEEVLAKKRKIMLASLITSESFFIPRAKPSSVSPRLSMSISSTSKSPSANSSLTTVEQEEVPVGDIDQV